MSILPTIAILGRITNLQLERGLLSMLSYILQINWIFKVEEDMKYLSELIELIKILPFHDQFEVFCTAILTFSKDKLRM